MDDGLDKGHMNLLVDLELVLAEARAKEYHDFENETYATPKMELVRKLESIINNTKNGKYDN